MTIKDKLKEAKLNYDGCYGIELESCDRWIKWCEKQGDTHGTNFHQGQRSALVYHNIKMGQMFDTLNQIL